MDGFNQPNLGPLLDMPDEILLAIADDLLFYDQYDLMLSHPLFYDLFNRYLPRNILDQMLSRQQMTDTSSLFTQDDAIFQEDDAIFQEDRLIFQENGLIPLGTKDNQLFQAGRGRFSVYMRYIKEVCYLMIYDMFSNLTGCSDSNRITNDVNVKSDDLKITPLVTFIFVIEMILKEPSEEDIMFRNVLPNWGFLTIELTIDIPSIFNVSQDDDIENVHLCHLIIEKGSVLMSYWDSNIHYHEDEINLDGKCFCFIIPSIYNIYNRSFYPELKDMYPKCKWNIDKIFKLYSNSQIDSIELNERLKRNLETGRQREIQKYYPNQILYRDKRWWKFSMWDLDTYEEGEYEFYGSELNYIEETIQYALNDGIEHLFQKEASNDEKEDNM